MFERRVSQELDDRALEFTNTRPDILGDEADDVLGNGELEVIEVGLLAEDRNAVLEIGHVDIGHHAPLKA